MTHEASTRPGFLAGKHGCPILFGYGLWVVLLTLGVVPFGCSPPSECQETVELVRKCRLNSGIVTMENLDKQVAMCEAARKTWPDVQDEIDCALEAAGDCPEYRTCERRVQRQRLIDEAMRRRSQGRWKPNVGWCSIFDEHRSVHPELTDLCPLRSRKSDERQRNPERQVVAPSQTVDGATL